MHMTTIKELQQLRKLEIEEKTALREATPLHGKFERKIGWL